MPSHLGSHLSSTWRLHTDGGARGNPGPAGIGAVLEDPSGELIAEVSQAIGWTTNNVAEYTGLIAGMESALAHDVEDLEVYMDSLLVVQQMKGIFKVKSEGLKPLYARARTLAQSFARVRFYAIPREQNTHADRLMNEGIDEAIARGESMEAPPGNQSLF